MELLIGKFCQFLTELSSQDMSIFSFLDYNLSKYQRIFSNLVCALILWTSALGLLMVELSVFDSYLPAIHTPTFTFRTILNLSKSQWIFTKFDMCIDIVEICFRLLIAKFHQFLTKLSAHDTIMAGYYYCFMFYLA